MILGKFKKQPGEVLDYDVSYEDFFSNRNDTLNNATVVADAGITVDSVDLNGELVKVVLSGGTNGVTYKVTVTMTTTIGIVKEDEFQVTVKEI